MATFKELREFTRRGAEHYGIDPSLAFAVFEEESKWNPEAVSPKGALGIAQLMPGTAKDLGVNPADPWENIDGGLRYLKQQLDKFGKPDLAIAAYNAGPGAVEKAGGIPANPETPGHVLKVMQRYGEIRQQRLARTGKMGDAETPIEATKPEDIDIGFAPFTSVAGGMLSTAGDIPRYLGGVEAEWERQAKMQPNLFRTEGGAGQIPLGPAGKPVMGVISPLLGVDLSKQPWNVSNVGPVAPTHIYGPAAGGDTEALERIPIKQTDAPYTAPVEEQALWQLGTRLQQQGQAMTMTGPLGEVLHGVGGVAALAIGTKGLGALAGATGGATGLPAIMEVIPGLTSLVSVAPKALSAILNYGPAAVLGALAAQPTGYEMAREAGMSVGEAQEVAQYNMLVGTSMAAPVGRALSMFDRFSGGAVKKYIAEAAKSGVSMAGTMAFMNTANNYVAKMNYDQQREVLQGVLSAMPKDFAIGALTFGIGAAAAKALRASGKPVPPEVYEWDERSKSYWKRYVHGWYEAESEEAPPPPAAETPVAPPVEPKKELSETELEKKVRTVEKKLYGEKQATRVQQYYRDTYRLDFEIVDSETEGKFQLKRKAAEASAAEIPIVETPTAEAELRAEFEQNERDSEAEIPANVPLLTPEVREALRASMERRGLPPEGLPLSDAERAKLRKGLELAAKWREEQAAKRAKEETPPATSVNPVDIGKGLQTTAEQRSIDDAAVEAFEKTQTKDNPKGSYVQAAKAMGLSIAETKARIKYALGLSEKRPYEVSDETHAPAPKAKPEIVSPLVREETRGRAPGVEAPPEFGSKVEADIWLEDNKMIGTIVPKGKGFRILDLRPMGSSKFYSLQPILAETKWYREDPEIRGVLQRIGVDIDKIKTHEDAMHAFPSAETVRQAFPRIAPLFRTDEPITSGRIQMLLRSNWDSNPDITFKEYADWRKYLHDLVFLQSGIRALEDTIDRLNPEFRIRATYPPETEKWLRSMFTRLPQLAREAPNPGTWGWATSREITYARQTTLWHELGHYLFRNLHPGVRMELYDRLFSDAHRFSRGQVAPTQVQQEPFGKFGHEITNKGADSRAKYWTSPDEVIANIIGHQLLEHAPSQVLREIGPDTQNVLGRLATDGLVEADYKQLTRMVRRLVDDLKYDRELMDKPIPLMSLQPISPWFSKLQEEVVKDHANWPKHISGVTALERMKKLVESGKGKKEELDDMLRLTGLKQRLEAMEGAKKDDVLNEIMSNGIEVEEHAGVDNSILLTLTDQGIPIDTLSATWHTDSTGNRSLSLPLVEDPILHRRLLRYGAEHNADSIRQINAQGEETTTSLTPEAKEFWRKNPMAIYSLSPFMMTPENARGLREVMEDQAVRGGVPRDIARGYHSDDMGPVEKVCALTQWLVDKNPRLYPIFDATHRAMERASTGLQKAIEPWAATWLGFKQEQKRTVTDTLVELDRAADELRKEGKSPYAERGITEPRWIKVGRSGIKINPAHWEQWREKTAEKLGLPEEEMEMVFQQRKMYDTVLEAKWNLTRKFYRRGSKGIQDLRHEVFELEDYFPHTRTGEFAVAGYVKLPDGTMKKVYDYAFDPPAQLYELQRFGNKFEVRRIGDRASYGTYKTREKAQAAQKKLGAEYEVADIGLRGIEGYVERVLRPIINKDPTLADLGIEPGNWRIERRESSYVQGLQNQPLLAMALQKTTDGAIRAIRKNTTLTAEQKEAQIKAYEQLWNSAVAQTLKKATMGGHWAKRSGVYGYDTGDAGKIAHAYAEQFYNTLSKMEMVGELTRLTGAIKGDRPREAKYAANYMQRVLNPQQDLSKLMYGLRGLAYWMHINPIKFFGGNITNGLVGGATQLVTDAGNKAWGFVPKAMHDAARWYAKREGLTADENQFLAGLFDSGVARPQYLDAMGMRLKQDPSASMLAYRWQQAKNFVSWPARTSEIYSRLYTALAAYRVAKAGLVNSDRAIERFGAGIKEKIEGKPTEEQYKRLSDYASKVVDDSHMIWGELNRPELVTQTGVVGRLGGSALIFRHYAQGLVHMWKSMWKEGRPGDRRGQMAMAESMAVQMLLGGMIGGTIISSAYEKFMGTSMWDDLRKKFGTKPVDALKYGPLALTGFNYHSSFDMEPPSSWEELFGVPASMVRNYQKAWQAAGVGDYKRAFEYAVPLKIARDISVGLRQHTVGLTTAGGRAIPGPGTGREPYKTSTFDMIKQFGGFTPLDVTRLQDTRREVQSIEARRQAKQDELVTRYINARRAGDWAEIDDIWAEVAEWNDKWREKGVPQLTLQLRTAINARMRPEKPSKKMRGLARRMMQRALDAELELAD